MHYCIKNRDVAGLMITIIIVRCVFVVVAESLVSCSASCDQITLSHKHIHKDIGMVRHRHISYHYDDDDIYFIINSSTRWKARRIVAKARRHHGSSVL